MRLQFPGISEDMDDAYGNALDRGAMQRDDQGDRATFFASFELIASELAEDGGIISDWFRNKRTDQYIRVERKENST